MLLWSMIFLLKSSVQPVKKLQHFYFVERYPFVTGTGLTEEDVRSSREQVQQLIEKLRTETSQPEG